MKRSAGELTLRIEYRPLAELLALRWVENPKDHDLGLIHQSIDEHGFNDPVTLGRVGKQEMLVEGHGRLECLAQKMNAGDRAPARIKAKFKGRYQVDWLVPVNIGVEFPTLQKAKKYALQHNRLTEMGGYHDDKLLEALKEQQLDLAGIGWDDDDLHALGIGMEPPPEAPEAQLDRAAELQKAWKTATGQLWALGDHRLLCGDSTKREDVERVMGGKKADAIFTDPPYGQSQKGVPGDSPNEMVRIVPDACGLLPASDAVAVLFQSPRTFIVSLDAMRANGWKFDRALWLYKQAQCVKPWRGWLLKSEAILVFSKGEGNWNECKPYVHDCYMLPEVSGELSENSGWHGSVKPMKVVVDICKRISKEGQLVFDPFLGSGTTLIACEQIGRKCRAIEISPAYVAVALQRWAGMTGKKPKRSK